MTSLFSLSNTAGPAAGVIILLISITSTQIGSAAAKLLFVSVGPEATVALRLFFATGILFAVLRPWRNMPDRAAWKAVIVYGIAIAFMNGCFYQAISRIPLGIAVAVEFSGPLLVAVCSSRRWTDLAGIVLAVAGLLLILPWSGFEGGLNLEGVCFALAAAAGWAGYIVFGRKAGGCTGMTAAAWGMLTGTLLVMPWAVMETGFLMFDPGIWKDVLPLAFFVGLMASALPYALEIVALRIVPPQAYGVLMSLEPAAAALFGFLILGEVLAVRQWCAIGLIILASLLVTLNSRRA